jgi:predicted histidine transporter YuiF (NhaC family)
MDREMRTLLSAIVGAFIGGVYEAFATFELMRIGAYSLAQGIAIVLTGAVVGAVVLAAASTALGMYLSRKDHSADRR